VPVSASHRTRGTRRRSCRPTHTQTESQTARLVVAGRRGGQTDSRTGPSASLSTWGNHGRPSQRRSDHSAPGQRD
jgi:hypothetical protein